MNQFRGQTFGRAGLGTAASPRSDPLPSDRPFGHPSAQGAPGDPAYAANLPAEPQAQVECPFCAEMIAARARKCRHCGETVDVAMRKAEEAMRFSERSGHVYMNAGGGAVAGAGQQQLRPYNHLLHIFLSFITLGWWLPVYLILYLCRNKAVYY